MSRESVRYWTWWRNCVSHFFVWWRILDCFAGGPTIWAVSVDVRERTVVKFIQMLIHDAYVVSCR